MTRNRPSGADDLATALLTASRVLVGVSARSLTGVEDTVTLTQFRTLVVLGNHGGRPLRALAEELDVNASTALRMVDRLVDRGLVERSADPDDRRAVVLDLTEEGRAIVSRVTGNRRREITRIVRRMPQAHRTEMVAALRSFAEAAGEPAVEDRW